jgi:hypothetical protein
MLFIGSWTCVGAEFRRSMAGYRGSAMKNGPAGRGCAHPVEDAEAVAREAAHQFLTGTEMDPVGEPLRLGPRPEHMPLYDAIGPVPLRQGAFFLEDCQMRHTRS